MSASGDSSERMNEFDAELGRRLCAIREQGLHRQLRSVGSPQGPQIEIGGKALINFSSNDYLGLANDPGLKEAALSAIERYGAGSGASRLISGTLRPHTELEEALADFKRTQAALSFSSGYAAAVGTICALLGKEDVIVIDRLAHACIVDAAKLCGARLRVFAHNDLNGLERILQRPVGRCATQGRAARTRARVLIVTESLFSMDGDQAPLSELVALKERYGAWLMVDEAHATGLYGQFGRGLSDAKGVADRVEIQMGTLSKALGSSGGFVCGSKALIDYLVNRARTFIFSTAPTPGAASAATAGIEFVRSPQGGTRRAQLWERVETVRNMLAAQGWKLPEDRSPILPLLVGAEAEAVALADGLLNRGIFVPAIRYPTVRRGDARLRVSVSAVHSMSDIHALGTVLQENRPAAAAVAA